MKYKHQVLSFIILGISSSRTWADPPTCTKLWIGPSSAEVWSECDYWYDLEDQEVGICPSNQDVACITDGAEVTIYFQQFAPAEAKAIYVDSTSELVIYDADSLVLCGGSSCVPSHIDGGLEIYDGGGKLKIGQNVTINGSGHIEFGLEGGTAPAEIEAVSGTPTLTLGVGLTLEGKGNVEVKLINNGTVEAKSGTLAIQQGGEGSGTWTAVSSTGHLHVLGAIKGAGSWILDDHASAKIEIDAACECLTGNVSVSLGTLDADQDFRTTGQLYMGGSNSLVDVAGTRSAKFSMQTQLPSCTGGGGGGD